jgi:putative endonuclease
MIGEVNRSSVLHFPRAASLHGKPLGRKEIAAIGEQIALDYLLKNGHVLVERNWRSGRFGEIDLIVRDATGLWIFVEVKTRRIWQDNSGFVDYGFDAINWKKRRKILITARSYLERRRVIDQRARCDAVLVTYDAMIARNDTVVVYGASVMHIPAAFDS